MHILSVSYDPVLLNTRRLLLEAQGYTVTSAEGFTGAFEACQRGDYDLAIIGHSIAHRDKQALAREFRKHCAAPILALLRVGEERLEEADFSIAADEPVQLLETVRRLLILTDAAKTSSV